VKTTMRLCLAIGVVWGLVACAIPQPAALQPPATETATSIAVTPTTAARLNLWRSPDKRVTLRIPRGWKMERHEEAGRTLWLWTPNQQQGLLSLLVIASPIRLELDQRRELLLQAAAQLDATPDGEIQTEPDGSLVLYARNTATSRNGSKIPMWIRVSGQQFEDSEAIVVLAMPVIQKRSYEELVPTIQASLAIVPLPTATPVPTATPAPFTVDAFDSDDGRWFIGDDLRRQMVIGDGVYHMYLRMSQSYYLSAPAEVERYDQSITVKTRFDGVARIGVAARFRYRPDDTRDYVACWISPIQRYGCFGSDGDVWTAYQDVATSDVIVPDGENVLQLVLQGDTYEFTVNGVVLAAFSASRADPGVPALYVETFDSAAGGYFDDVETK
jgi:hypothetical protein